MNIPLFDQSKKDDLTFEGEAVRLSNELRSKPARTYINNNGVRVDVPSKRGFDVETCQFMDIVNWLADSRIKKSESQISLCHRIMSIRFPHEYTQHRDKINMRYKIEYEMIQSNSKNDVSWIGEVGFQNMVRLDKSINNNSIKINKSRNDEIKIKRK